MVQIWIHRELAGAVSEEAIQRVYDTLQPHGGEAVPPVEQLRPQIEQHLRQQAMQEIQSTLRQDAEVVFYDPSGQPIQQAGDASRDLQGTQNAASDAGATAAPSGEAQPKMQAEAAEEPPLVGGRVGVQIQDVTPQIAGAGICRGGRSARRRGRARKSRVRCRHCPGICHRGSRRHAGRGRARSRLGDLRACGGG